MKQECNPGGSGEIIYSGTPTAAQLKKGNLMMFYANVKSTAGGDFYTWGLSGICLPGYSTQICYDINGTKYVLLAKWDKTNGTLTFSNVSGGIALTTSHIIVFN